MWSTASNFYYVGSLYKIDFTYIPKAVPDGPVGEILAGPLFIKVKTKFNFTESK